jgi:hypothetical protein
MANPELHGPSYILDLRLYDDEDPIDAVSSNSMVSLPMCDSKYQSMKLFLTTEQLALDIGSDERLQQACGRLSRQVRDGDSEPYSGNCICRHVEARRDLERASVRHPYISHSPRQSCIRIKRLQQQHHQQRQRKRGSTKPRPPAFVFLPGVSPTPENCPARQLWPCL